MYYKKSLIKTFKETPKEADAISAALLLRASYIKKVSAGIYDFLPLGWQVMQNLVKIIREEMNALGGQEIFMPTLQPKEMWQETGRWEKFDPPLFVVKDRHEKEYAVGPTHEEAVTDIAKDFFTSYKELPQMLYQIQTKLRNEMRATGGLLRVREFLMKDAYSFHADKEDFDNFYQKVIGAYYKIYKRVGIDVKMVEAHSGSIGGEKSNEFMMLSETGEDTIYTCQSCDYAANEEVVADKEKCPKCSSQVKPEKAIEVGHIFQLGDLYSKKMNALFLDKDGKQKPSFMGCYGIGIGRLMASIVEKNHDETGIIWPKEVAPQDVYLIDLEGSKGEEIYNKLSDNGFMVLFDDREVSAGVKFADADLLGIPYRLVISEKTLKEGNVEIKKRSEKETKFIRVDMISEELHN